MKEFLSPSFSTGIIQAVCITALHTFSMDLFSYFLLPSSEFIAYSQAKLEMPVKRDPPFKVLRFIIKNGEKTAYIFSYCKDFFPV